MSFLPAKKGVPLPTLTHLMNEIILYLCSKAKGSKEIEAKLFSMGESLGYKVYEMEMYGERQKKKVKLTDFATMLKTTFWKHLFNTPLKVESVVAKGELYLIEPCTAVDRYYSPPKDYPNLKPSTFVSGLIKGILTTAGYSVSVTTQMYKPDGGEPCIYHVVKEE